MYLGMFADKENMAEAFAVSQEELEGCRILFAAYEDAGYDGYAMVVYAKEGKLYEVHGSHCSCHGLEGQWSPEETSLEALRGRNYNHGELQVDLEKFLLDFVFERDVLVN